MKRDQSLDMPSWLVLADRYVAEAQAKWEETKVMGMAMEVLPANPRRARQHRHAKPTLKRFHPGNYLGLADRYIRLSEFRLAQKAREIARLSSSGRSTRRAEDQFWVIGHLLDAARERKEHLMTQITQTQSHSSIGPELQFSIAEKILSAMYERKTFLSRVYKDDY